MKRPSHGKLQTLTQQHDRLVNYVFETFLRGPVPVLQLVEALEWCLDLGVQCVTVYAFSIENYNRSQYEVDTLMGLADARLRRLFKVTF